MNDTMGIYPKYTVTRNDNRDVAGEKHCDCDLFVLDLTHDSAAVDAVVVYACSIEKTRPQLSKELLAKYGPRRESTVSEQEEEE